MKRFFIIAAFVALLNSCTNSDELAQVEVTTPEETTGITLTATITMSQDEEESRVSSSHDSSSDNYKFTWDADDATDNVFAICIVSDAEGWGSTTYQCVKLSASSITTGSATATFTGTLPGSTSKFRIIYKSDNASVGGYTSMSDITSSVKTINPTIDISSQNGGFDSSVMMSDLIGNINLDTDITDIVTAPTLYHTGGFLTFNVTLGDGDETLPSSWYGVTVDKVVVSGLSSDLTPKSTAYSIFDIFTVDEIVSNGTSEGSEITINVRDDNEDPIVVEVGTTFPVELNYIPTSTSSMDVYVYFSNGTYTKVTRSTGSDTKISFDRATFYTDSDSFSFNSLSYLLGGATADAADVTFSSGAGEATSYNIYTEKHLAALAALANDGKLADNYNYTFTLQNDIEITSPFWTPIGFADAGLFTSPTLVSASYFGGVFDGGGHSITGCNTNIESSNESIPMINGYLAYPSIGLFGYIRGATTVVKNLTLKDCNVTLNGHSGKHIGILAGTIENGATIINCGCDEDCSVSTTSRNAVGGLVGYVAESNVKIYNSYNNGSIYAVTTDGATLNVGGLIGSTADSNNTGTIITNCYNSGAITASTSTGTLYTGGITGNANGNDTYTNVYYRTYDQTDDPNGSSVFNGNGDPDVDYDTTEGRWTLANMKGTTFLGVLNTNAATLAGSYTANSVYTWKQDTSNNLLPIHDFTTPASN